MRPQPGGGAPLGSGRLALDRAECQPYGRPLALASPECYFSGPPGRTPRESDSGPLYCYAEDAGPGDTAGQGVGGVWWVVDPEGDAVEN